MSIKRFSKFSKRLFAFIFCLTVFLCLQGKAYCALEEGEVPEFVKVKPMFFVPADQKAPTQAQKVKLMKHLRLCQKVYKRMLKDRDTFQIEEGMPLIVRGKGSISSYKTKSPASGNTVMSHETIREIFDKYGWNRFNCPYVLLIIVMNSNEMFPAGWGRPFNRGFNGGGGFAYITSYSLDNWRNFQGTLGHELGHAFGLTHVTAYGYDKETNRSIMSSNDNNYWDGFRPSRTPGILIPEDLQSLARNKKVFPNFYFDRSKDVPSGYKLYRLVRIVFPMKLPGEKENQIETSTSSGKVQGSSVSNIVHNLVLSKRNSFSAKRMWMSEVTETGWVNATVTFPVPVSLCKIGVHSQHSSKYHIAEGVRVEVLQDGKFKQLCEESITSADAYVSFPKHKSTTWRFHFRAGESKQVVIRALRFFSSDTNEIFCPTYPYAGP